MDARKQFLAQIKQVLNPILKSEGFTTSGNTYRREIGEVIHVIALQGSVHGGQCCVCLGIHLNFLSPFDPQKIEEPDCEFRTRLKSHEQSDAWWSYGTTEREAKISAESICHLYQQVGSPYFRRFSKFPDDFNQVKPAMLSANLELPFPNGSTFVRRALALAKIAQRCGQTNDARQFSEAGLAQVGPATSLKFAFKKIMEASQG